MLNKIQEMLTRYQMVSPGDTVYCAVSGGADSMALLWGMYLLREKLSIHLAAAHFNHGLRGEESDGDEVFVREFCRKYEIPLAVGSGKVEAGKKGLEAAAREARYRFFHTLPGKIATAHTADDNAETVLLHLIRGTGLKGLGAISPTMGNVIRPMLGITRQEVEAFLGEYFIPCRQDSSNDTDQFLRNRLRHHVMPLLKEENPRLAENLSAMALRLRQDEAALSRLSVQSDPGYVPQLREMLPAQRSRALETLLKQWGVREPEAEHIALAESLVFSDKPSAKAYFPGNVTVGRNYHRLERLEDTAEPEPVHVPCPGTAALPQLGLRICCGLDETEEGQDCFTVYPEGKLILRSRLPGDEITRNGGTKSLKKLFIDRKIPAQQRQRIPVLADDRGVLWVDGIGVNLARLKGTGQAVRIRIERT